MVAAAKAAQDMAARMPLGRSGSLPLLVMLVAPLTLRSVHPSSLDSRRSVSVSPRSGMIDGGTAVKVCLEPSDSLAPLVLNRTKCALYSAADDDNSPIYGVRPAITFGSAGRNFSATSVWNASCAVCVLPPVIVPGTSEMVLGVVSRATGNTSWSSSTRVAYFDPAEVAFSLRPYIAERNGSLLLAPHASMATTSSTFDVALHLPFALPGAQQVHSWSSLNTSKLEHVLSFPLDGLPPTVNQDCRIVVSFTGGPTVERLRRLQRAPPLPDGSTVLAVQVDASRRSLRVDGRTWRGIGYYMADFGQGGYWWGFDDLADLALRGLAPHGINQAMLYNFQYYPLDAQRAFLDRAAAVGLKVMLQVSQGWIKRNNGNLDHQAMAPQLQALTDNITAVADHPAILG
eukprot:COSAG06_NODE_2864_length_6158_cov_3.302855_3_plen_401_part_00